MSDPGRDRLQRILALARAHRPGLRMVDKADSPLMRVLAVGARPFMPHFLDRVTTVLGDTVYTPGPPESLPEGLLARILAHELVHQMDQARWGPLFYVSYVAVLPLWRTTRAVWERRAYAVDLMLAHHDDGAAGLEMERRRLAVIFGGPSYAWMWGGRAAAERFLQPVVDAVAEGRLQQQSPYDDILEAWVGRAQERRGPLR